MRARSTLHSYFANQKSSIDNHQSITAPCRVIIVIVEQPHSTDATIQHMKYHPARGNTRGSWHQDMLRETKYHGNKCACPLVFFEIKRFLGQ